MSNVEQSKTEQAATEQHCTPEVAEILSRFSSHVPDEDCVRKMRAIRAEARKFALVIQGLCPNSREKATALTHLQAVMMNANSAIVQAFPVDPKEFE